MEIREIDVDELAQRLASAEPPLLLDVRQRAEHDEAHIPVAMLVPLDRLPDHLASLPRDREIAVICRSGARSAVACDLLTTTGLRSVNVRGGMLAWISGGHDFAGAVWSGGAH